MQQFDLERRCVSTDAMYARARARNSRSLWWPVRQRERDAPIARQFLLFFAYETITADDKYKKRTKRKKIEERKIHPHNICLI